MKTVRDMRAFVLQESGFSDWFCFVTRSTKHLLFWKRLNDLGWEKRTQEPQRIPNIDATAFLTDEEWALLIGEFRELA